MKRNVKIGRALLGAAAALALFAAAAGCAKQTDGADSAAKVNEGAVKVEETKEIPEETPEEMPKDETAGTLTEAPAQENSEAPAESGAGQSAKAPLDLPQLSPMKDGEQIVILDTTMGEIRLRFFPQYAPKAVENFITHAKNGYYDGVIFHRVIPGFMIQGGDPEGTGMGGESIWGGGFGLETTPSLRHFRGAVAMAHSSAPDSNGSQFYIVQNSDLDIGANGQKQDLKAPLKEMLDTQDEVMGQDASGATLYVRDIYPPEVIDAYVNNGGTLSLDGGYTVFGQAYEGMDVVDAIANVEVDDPNSQAPKPLVDVVINKAAVGEYRSAG